MTVMRTRQNSIRLAVLAVLLVVLAACGGAAQPAAAPKAAAPTTAPAAPTSAPAQAAAPTAAPAASTSAPAAGAPAAKAATLTKLANPVTLEVMAIVRSTELAAPGPDWIVAKAVKEQLNIDLKMTWVTNSSEYDRLVLTRGAANDLPDLFRSTTVLARDLGAQGLLGDWKPLFTKMPVFVQQREAEKLAPIGTFDGKLYALTTAIADPYKQSVAIRKDWLDKLGLQEPKTLDDYMAVMKAFTEKDPDGNGRADTYGWSGAVNTLGQIQNFDPIFGAFGALGDWRIDNGKLVFVPTSAERLEALKFLNQMNTAGVIDPDWKTQKPEDFRNKWKGGKIGIFQEDWCAGFCSGNHDPFAKANPTGRLIDIAPPVGPTGKSAINAWNRVGGQYSMSQKAIQAGKGDAIALFMEWLNGPGYYLTTYGEEGKMWKREGGKIIPDQANDFRIVRALSAWSINGSDEEMRARYDQTTTYPNGQTIPVWEIVERAAKNAKYDITDFAVLPTAPAANAGDLSRLRAEAELQFVTGQRPFTQWDAYVQSMKAAGLDTWMTQAEARAKEVGLVK